MSLEADRFRRDASAIQTRRGVDHATIAFTGPTGHGKTSLLRLLVRASEVHGRLRAGVRSADRTQRVVWVGPQRPDDLDADHEDHVPSAPSALVDLGRPVALVDTPGFSNRSGRLVQIAEDALSDAELHVLVVRRDQVERADVLAQAERSSGALILPVVRTRDLTEETLGAELDAFHTALRASGGFILRPVVVPDVDVSGVEAWEVVRATLVRALTAALASLPDPEALVTKRLDARTHRLRRRVRQLVQPVRDRVEASLSELESEGDRVPGHVVRAVLGSDRVLEAGLRGRLRVELSEATWGIWFPYRPMLAMVQLTHGAWDRLVLAMSGSLPSWFGTLFAAGRQLRDAATFEQAAAGLRDRVTATASDRLGPLLGRFDRALVAVAGGERSELAHHGAVRLEGLSELQEASGRIVDEVVARHAVSGAVANLAGLLSTAVFWVLFSGPIVALYRGYLGAGVVALTGTQSETLGLFPTPTLSFWMTSLALSALPAFLLTVLFVATMVSAGRVRRAADEVREAHDAAIDRLREEGVRRLEVSDPRLTEARFLLRL